MPGPALRGQSQRVREDADLVQGRACDFREKPGPDHAKPETHVLRSGSCLWHVIHFGLMSAYRELCAGRVRSQSYVRTLLYVP